jgi:pentatricopeptide repeat protein
MNVCIKSNEVQLAQEVYKQVRRRGPPTPHLRQHPHPLLLLRPLPPQSGPAPDRPNPPARQMREEGCTPNLVTFNTLIDLYVKTGQWQEAIGVLDTLEQLVGAALGGRVASPALPGAGRLRGPLPAPRPRIEAREWRRGGSGAGHARGRVTLDRSP